MAGDSTSLSTIGLLDARQSETIKIALNNLKAAHESYLLSERVNDALIDLLESDELTEEISRKLRTVLRSSSDLFDLNVDDDNGLHDDDDDDDDGLHDDGIEKKDSCAILGLSRNSADMENSRLTVAEDSELFMKVHGKLLSWCSHAQTLEKVLLQRGLTDYIDQPRDSLLNDNQCLISKLRHDLCRLIEKRVTLSKEMQSLQIEDGAIIDNTVEELTKESTVAPTMTAEEARTRAREIQHNIETLVTSKDVDPVLALQKLHRMLDKEIEAKELTRKRLNAKLAAYKQLEEKSEFAIILRNYLKVKSASLKWKWTLDELKISPEY